MASILVPFEVSVQSEISYLCPGANASRNKHATESRISGKPMLRCRCRTADAKHAIRLM